MSLIATSGNIHEPLIDTAFNEQLRRKKRAIVIRQASKSYLRGPLLDTDGNVVDLTSYGFASDDPDSSSEEDTNSIEVRFRDSALVDKRIYVMIADASDADNGEFNVAIPAEVANKAGIYLTEAGVVDSESDLLFSNEFYVYVEHSAWAPSGNIGQTGPPSFDDIRLSLSDSDPLENELLSSYDFGAVEVALAATRTVQFWNDQPPKITGATYSTITFPFREIWTLGTRLFLFDLLEEHYRRNRMPYNAGGVSVDDKAKHRDYMQAKHDQIQQFRNLVMHNKAQLNARRAYSSVSSSYYYS